MTVYIIKVTGYDANNTPYSNYWKPYVKSFGSSYLETTENFAFAKIWMKRNTAEKNALRVEDYLHNLYHPHPNAKAEVLEVEMNIINPNKKGQP